MTVMSFVPLLFESKWVLDQRYKTSRFDNGDIFRHTTMYFTVLQLFGLDICLRLWTLLLIYSIHS